MKIKLLSDLHHEFMSGETERNQPYFQYAGEDVLVLAGDIASGSTNVMSTISKFRKNGFPHVLYVPGNHEYYGTSIRDFDAKMRIKTQHAGGVQFMNPGMMRIDDVTFLGGALWTNFRNSPSDAIEAKRCITDFRLIDGFVPSYAAELYTRQLGYLKAMYEQRTTEKVVIVTHFLPAVECISKRYQDPSNALNSYFANDLGDWIETLDNTTWMFGHTHDTIDVTIGTTRCISNPYGYHNYEVNPAFDNEFVIHV